MADIRSGQVYINNIDIYNEYGAFLSEERKGGRENLKSIHTPSPTKKHVAVNFRERTGEKHAKELLVVNEARDVTLTFCIYAPTQEKWLQQYNDFIAYLKRGEKGWLVFRFPSIKLELKMYYQSCASYAPLTYLWRQGVQASHFKIKFREPEPVL